MAAKMMALAGLTEDFSLYPRNRVDDTHVNDLVRALAADVALPLIVVDEQGRIVDGVHRRRAMLKHFGPEAKTKVDVRKYKNDAAMFADAVALNSQHGRKLDRHDHSRIVLRFRELGVSDAEIAVVLHVPEPEVQTLAVRVVYGPGGEAIPAKRGMKHMFGKPVTDVQVKVMESVRSAEIGRLCMELTRLMDAGMVDLSDDTIVMRLRELQKSLTACLRAVAA